MRASKKAKAKRRVENLALVGLGDLDSVTLEVAPEFLERVAELTLELSGLPDRIGTDDVQEQAIAVTRTAKEISREVEAVRVRLKAPVLRLGRTIDNCVKLPELQAMEKEVTRVQRVLAAYELERREIARKQEEELREQQRTALEGADPLNPPAEFIRAQGEIAELQATAKTEGARLLQKTCWEVTDREALLKARPDLFKTVVNEELVQVLAEQDQLHEVPGLRVWKEAKLSV